MFQITIIGLEKQEHTLYKQQLKRPIVKCISLIVLVLQDKSICFKKKTKIVYN